MKRIQIIGFLLSLVLVSQSAHAKKIDVFFRFDNTNFMKTDIVDCSSGDSGKCIKFSACSYITQTDDTLPQKAKCQAVAQVDQAQFKLMQACMETTDFVITTAAVTGVLIATSGAGMILIYTTGAAAGLIAVVADASTDSSIIYGDTSRVYSTLVEHDVDHSTKITFGDFLSTLQDSMEHSFFLCDTNGGSEILHSNPEEITLSEAQLVGLNRSKTNPVIIHAR